MVTSLYSGIGSVCSWVSPWIPKTAKDQASSIASKAVEIFNQLTLPAQTAPVQEVRIIKAQSCYKDLHSQLVQTYERSHVIQKLRAGPHISKSVTVSDYLSLLPQTKITYKIYERLKTKWGYSHFHRMKETGIRGLCIAFMAHLFIEDAHKTPPVLLNKLLRFYETHQKDAPMEFKEVIEGLRSGNAFVYTFLDSLDNTTITSLCNFLIKPFLEDHHIEEEINLESFIAAMGDQPIKADVIRTFQALKDDPIPMLVNLLGPKQSFFGTNSLRKFSFVLEQLPKILDETKMQMKARIDSKVICDWLDELKPQDLLVCFDIDPVGIAKKEHYKPMMMDLFKQILIKNLTPNRSLFLEGFSFSKKTQHTDHINLIADELLNIDGSFLYKILSIDIQGLSALAKVLEDYEEELIIRNLSFINYLSQLFDTSFIIHSWQMSSQEKKRLKIDHLGPWHKKPVHLVLFPENNLIKVDLLSPQGEYLPRNELSDLFKLPNFKLYKRHGSERLSLIAQSPSTSEDDKKLARHLLYFRLHVFSCIQKMVQVKLPLLKDPVRFDSCGSKEDDGSSSNPFGPDYPELAATYDLDEERKMHQIETHLCGLNREIAELSFIADSIFSKTKHEEMMEEIHNILKSCKKATFHFYVKKIPEFLEKFESIIKKLEALIHFGSKKVLSRKEEYLSVFKDLEKNFDDAFMKEPSSSVTFAELIPLIPRAYYELNTPEIILQIQHLKKQLDLLHKSKSFNFEATNLKIKSLFQASALLKEHYFAFYPESKKTAERFFEIQDTNSIDEAALEALLPKEKLHHEELLKMIQSMQSLHDILKQKKLATFYNSSEFREEVKQLFERIKAQHEMFKKVNPSSLALFEKVFSLKKLEDVSLGDLLTLKTLQKKEAYEEIPIIKEISELIKLVKKKQAFKKEFEKLLERYGKDPASFIDVDMEDEEGFPDAGSLGSIDHDTASLGGASFSSDLQSIRSVENFLDGVLL